MRTFEDFLMEKHGEHYVGTKDCMIDDFNKWVSDLGADEFIEYGNQALASIKAELLEKLPKERDTFGAAIDIFKAPNIGFNDCRAHVNRIIDEVCK